MKIKEHLIKAWKWLSGKKRRIAIIGMLLAKLTPEHTVGHQVGIILKDFGEQLFYLFGGMDLTEQTIKQLQKKLPSGIRKKDDEQQIQ